MRAYNSGKRKTKLILRFLKGNLSISLTNGTILKNGVAKKKDNKVSLKKAGFGCRPLIWRLSDWLENASVTLKTGKKKTYEYRHKQRKVLLVRNNR